MKHRAYINVTFCADPADWARMQNFHPQGSLSGILRALIRKHLKEKLPPTDQLNVEELETDDE